jgi:hypothetical protein
MYWKSLLSLQIYHKFVEWILHTHLLVRENVPLLKDVLNFEAQIHLSSTFFGALYISNYTEEPFTQWLLLSHCRNRLTVIIILVCPEEVFTMLLSMFKLPDIEICDGLHKRPVLTLMFQTATVPSVFFFWLFFVWFHVSYDLFVILSTSHFTVV